MSAPVAAPGAPPTPEAPSALAATRGTGRLGDLVFRRSAIGASVVVLALMVGVGLFLLVEAIPALRADQGNFLTTTGFRASSDPRVFGIAALLFGTVVSSLIALVLAVPVAVAVALFISHYAPRRIAGVLGLLTDLLAAVPSVVYGLWGLLFLNSYVIDLSGWLERYLGFIPIFSTASMQYGRSYLLAGIVLAIMILPIIAAISREVFLQVPTMHTEAALALGATRWEMLRTAVLPYGRPGIIGASMLGLGRALGETIAVALVLASTFRIDPHILDTGGNTIAANIVNTFPEADDIGRGALIASGLVLFLLTLVVNFAARAVIARRAAFSGGA